MGRQSCFIVQDRGQKGYLFPSCSQSEATYKGHVLSTVCARYGVKSLIYITSFNTHISSEIIIYQHFANKETGV